MGDSRKIASILMLMLASALMTACEEVIDVDFTNGQTGNLVVEGMITTEARAHRVRLSYTSGYFNPSAQQWVTGAQVTISGGDSAFTLYEAAPGDYRTGIYAKGVPGRTYTLHVKLPDERQFEASSYLKQGVDIDSISQSANYNSYSGGYGYDVFYYGREPEPAGDYYFYRLYIENRLYTDTITEVSFVNDDFVNGNYVHDFVIYRIREKDLKTPSDVTLEMYSSSAEYNDFLSSLMLETVWRGSPWDGPPSNVPGNVSNNGRGFFLAADVKRATKMFFPTERVN
jgi:hypothetical protein